MTKVYTQLDLSKVVSFREIVIDTYKFIEFFGFETDPIVGLDIGSSSVKVLQLTKSNDKIRVEHFGMATLEAGVILEKNIVDREKVSAAIRQAVIKSGIKSQKMCAAITDSVAITKVVRMAASLNDKEIGAEIELEAGKIVPYPINEINLDYTVLGPVPNVESMVNVLVVATKSENIDSISGLIIDAGLTPSIIDIDSYAVARAFELVAKKLPGQGHGKIIAIFDIGAIMTTLTILDDMNVVYMREQEFGSHQLVDEVQNIYGLTYDEAILAMRYESLPKDYYREVLEPFKQSISLQISRACQFFISGGDYSTIDYVFLTGGCTSIFGFEKAVQDRLQVKSFIANPFDDMVLSSNINKEEFKNESSRLMRCCGLAMRDLVKK